NTLGKRRAELRLRDWLGSGENDARMMQIIREMYENAGRFWIEALFLRRMLREGSWQRFVTVQDISVLNTLAGEPRGCLFATMCFGNVAALACVLGHIFRPIH